jgi:hypothetical protein
MDIEFKQYQIHWHEQGVERNVEHAWLLLAGMDSIEARLAGYGVAVDFEYSSPTAYMLSEVMA